MRCVADGHNGHRSGLRCSPGGEVNLEPFHGEVSLVQLVHPPRLTRSADALGPGHGVSLNVKQRQVDLGLGGTPEGHRHQLLEPWLVKLQLRAGLAASEANGGHQQTRNEDPPNTVAPAMGHGAHWIPGAI